MPTYHNVRPAFDFDAHLVNHDVASLGVSGCNAATRRKISKNVALERLVEGTCGIIPRPESL